MSSSVVTAALRRSKVRYGIVAMLFLVTAINYGDRASMSMVGAPMSKQLGIDPIGLGYIFSAFSWAYVVAQIPGGWLLDRFGSRRVYFWSIFSWSVVTALQGFVTIFSSTTEIIIMLVLLRCLVGLAEAPSFPGNSRIVAAWFPANERGTAAAIFNSAQYFATVMFAPLMGWLIHTINWQSVFFVMGGAGILASLLWLKVIHNPDAHPSINKAELEYIEQGGGLVRIDTVKPGAALAPGFRTEAVKQMFASRMMVSVFVAQYCINALTYFFISWFPVYLVQARHMSILKVGIVAAIPAICGFAGGVLGGVLSDALQRMGLSLSLSRKIPIIGGMLLSMSILAANYTNINAVVIAVMAIAFFGKGVGALGWAVMADIAPREITGLTGGVFNMIGNASGIVTPIVIGYIVKDTGSFNGALGFIAAHAFVAVLCFAVLAGPLKRFEIRKG
ncbi:MFS transporter [Acidocella facilis]|uniref:MFS transporter n=1 Tax=Acidocella facilis TaxID=525 RepID=UPI00047DBD34|nr:MFS transporter [Acidocella facilis]